MATIQNNTMYGMRLQFKGANAADWSSDYVLLAGEVGFELDTKKYKLGDGVKTWAQLDYYSDPTISAAVDALTTRVTTAESDITALQGRATALEGRMDTAEGNITAHGTRLDTAEGDIDAAEGRLDTAEGNITSQGNRISALEGITVISGNPAPAA